MNHVMSQVEEQECPNTECEHCNDENGMLYEIKKKNDDVGDQTHVNDQGDDSSKNDATNQGKDVTHRSHDKFSLDEFHLLHSRLHGKALEDAEKTQNEQYAKVGSLSSRKEWLEKRRANAKKSGEDSEKEPEKHTIRSEEVNQNPPSTASIQTAKEKPGIKNYQYRQPYREYRSPHNGYDKSKHGYGASGGSTWRDQPPVEKTSVTNISEHPTEHGRKNTHRYSSINFHLAERIGNGDAKGEPDVLDLDHPRKSSTALALNNSGTTKWNSQIKANNIDRNTSRERSSNWQRHTHEEEELYEFMIPDNLRKKNGRGEKPKTTQKQPPYIYRRPSTLEPINDPPKTPKKNDKYSHIQSRYSKGIYQPGKPKQRYVISAHHKKDRRGQTRPENGKGAYSPQAYV